MTKKDDSTQAGLSHIFKNPPQKLNKEGKERVAGFEFEFGGIEMIQSARLLQRLYGGKITEISNYEIQVCGTELGDFKIELDAKLFHDKKYEEALKKLGVDVDKLTNKDKFEKGLRSVASAVVPFEIITSPIPYSSFHQLGKLMEEMKRLKVEGTGSSILNAFGLHLNPEIPDDDPRLLLDYLRAFVMLDPWIRKNGEVDISRRITPFINEFEKDYVKLILDEKYNPDLNQLITDYIEFDNTRNRALDMLPLFMCLNEELVKSLSDDERITGRPAFHYRLPNFSIEKPEWSIADEWNRWILVEQLAEDKKALSQYSAAYLKMRKEMLFGAESKWIELMQRWVDNRG